tara:strand:+ start:3672 stop:4172 length:501 start_codon:yes stop_codon:yes gene_type:complete
MWAVFKYKKENYKILKSNLNNIFKNKIIFYNPKISFEKRKLNKNQIITKHVLEGYAFCFNEKFSKSDVLQKIKYTRGLEYFLDGYVLNQSQILTFINLCKKNEDKNGNLNQNFFSVLEKHKAKFINGPFSNLIFEIIKKNKNNIKIKLGQIPLIINKNSNYYYRSI